MNRNKRWTIAQPDPRADELATQLKVSPLVAQVLVNRGIDTADAGRKFLSPSLHDLHDPSLLAGVPAAAGRIAAGIKHKQKIVVYGDYDADGITATAILWHAIRAAGGVVEYYIPHRIDEGYGLNGDAVGEIIDGGAGLMITVDCGVTAVAAAAVAKARGIDLIVTDHHEWKSDGDQPALPDCFAIVHPRLRREDGGVYPNPHLCGAGVAFKLAWAIGTAVSGGVKVDPAYRTFLLNATALAAMGTVADVVPLVGENRVLAHWGLTGLPKSTLTGIRALIEVAGLTDQKLDAYHVGFRLGPRLNASGRMGHAKLAVELLTDADPVRAREIAQFLDGQNRERQTTERTILDQAVDQAVELGCDDDDCRAVVLGSDQWHPGVIGIVASRLVERFHRPTIMIALGPDHGAGSGRSIDGFHLAKALESCTDLLLTHGGHEKAAGLKLHPQNLAAFRARFAAYAGRTLSADQLVPEVKIDATARLADLTEGLVVDLRRLEPFGEKNRRPTLAVTCVMVAGPVRRVGKQALHAQLTIRQDGTTMRGIVFNADERYDSLRNGQMIDVAGTVKLGDYQGQQYVELEVCDFRPAE